MRAIATVMAAWLLLGCAAAFAAGGQSAQKSRVSTVQEDDAYGGDEELSLDEQREMLRNELLRDRAADRKARAARASVGESERTRRDLQEAYRKRAEERGRAVLSERGESTGEATEEAKEVSRWARRQGVSSNVEGDGSKKVVVRKRPSRQSYNEMVSSMQAWASGKGTSKSKKSSSSSKKGGDGQSE
jgi:hypothetical protein